MTVYVPIPDSFRHRATAIGRRVTEMTASTIEEARHLKKELGYAQTELRSLRTEVVQAQKAIRADARTSRKQTPTNIGIALFLGQKNANAYRAGQREGSMQREAQQTAAYEPVKQYIDQLIIDLDRQKLALQRWMDEQQRR